MSSAGSADRERAARMLEEARELGAAGKLDAAERTLREALAEAALAQLTRVGCYLELGRTLDRRGRRFAAQNCYRRVLALTDDVALRSAARRLYRSAHFASEDSSSASASQPPVE